MPHNNRQVILVHYHEIALKGKNRSWFENKLVEHIKAVLKPIGQFKVTKEWGRILIYDFPPKADQPASTRGEPWAGRLMTSGLVIEKLSKIFGIAYFCPAQIVETKIEKLEQKCLELGQAKKFKTFRVSTKRCWKQFEMTSEQINRAVASYILKNMRNKKVDLKNFDLNIHIELSKDKTFVYLDKIEGAGGLPLGTGGKFLSLLSGGIDSPAAAYCMMKRGAQVDFIHYSSYPFIDKKSEDKVIRLAKLIVQSGNKSQVYIVHFGDIQKQIIAKCEPRFSILLYRRLMMQIAENIAINNNYQALITGESLGQVASQTIENLAATSQDIKIPILRPLIALDKLEIISIARQIDTYQTSIQPHPDCCSMFEPKNPVTRAKAAKLQHELNKLDLKNILDNLDIKIKVINK